MEHLLDDATRRARQRVTLLQVAAPSRSKLPAYRACRKRRTRRRARINERFGTRRAGSRSC
jgi:trehalose-6-phosphate synthase